MWQLGVVIVLLHLGSPRDAHAQLGTKSSHQCVIVTEMLGDILSMYSYRLSDSCRHLHSAGMPSVACRNGLVASRCIVHIQRTSGGTISSLLISGIRMLK